MFKGDKSAVAMAHKFIGLDTIITGLAVDATAGNGKDTVFLAQRLAKNGKIYSFDIQEQALQQTASLLKQQGLDKQVKLIFDGHQNIDKYVYQQLDAVMFNLGYLPGGDHSITTIPENTVKALNITTELLKVGGKISLVVYTGHKGGLAELAAIETTLSELDANTYWITKLNYINRPLTAPVLIFIERMG